MMTIGKTFQLSAIDVGLSQQQTTIQTDSEIAHTFDNRRTLTVRPFQMTTIRGFNATLEDPNHPLIPQCIIIRQIDNEDRFSVEVKLAFGNIPKKSPWARVNSSILMRSYGEHVNEWRLGDAQWQKMAEESARDKIVMRSNTESLLSEAPCLGNAFKMQNLVGGVTEIPNKIWKPCLKFSIAAAHSIINGEFPDFSDLNLLKPLTGKTYHETDQLLSYKGAFKPAEM